MNLNNRLERLERQIGDPDTPEPWKHATNGTAFYRSLVQWENEQAAWGRMLANDAEAQGWQNELTARLASLGISENDPQAFANAFAYDGNLQRLTASLTHRSWEWADR